jgi:hypothetical protein
MIDREEIIKTIKEMKKSGSTDNEIKKFLEQMDLAPDLIEQLMDVASASLLEEEEKIIEKRISDRLEYKLRDFENEFYDKFEERMKIERNSILNEADEKIEKLDKKYYEKTLNIEEKLQHIDTKLKNLEHDFSELKKDWEIFAWTSTRMRNLASWIFMLLGAIILIKYAWFVWSDPSSIILKQIFSGNIKEIVSAILYSLLPIFASIVFFTIGYYIPRRK